MEQRRKRGLAGLGGAIVASGVRGLIALLAWLPHRAALAIGRGAADLAHWLGVRRRTIHGNLERVFGPELGPDERRRIARSAQRNLILSIVEALRGSHPRARDEVLAQVRFEPSELYDDLVSAPQGFVVVPAHSGNFDLCGLCFVRDSDLRLTVVMKPPKVPPFDSLLSDARRSFGFDVLSVWEPGLLRRLIRLANAGGRVCLLPDQHARKSGVVTQFLGQPARTHKGPAFVALKADRARLLVAVDTRRDDGAEHVCYLREITDYAPSGDRRADVERLTQRINDAMGEIIGEHPGSYLWHHRRWRDLGGQRERAPEASSSEASSA